MNRKYILVRRNYVIDSVPYVGYGIICNCRDEKLIAEDLTTVLQDVIALINLCNRLDLSPLHFSDVIDDFLTDIYIDKPKATNVAFYFTLSCIPFNDDV